MTSDRLRRVGQYIAYISFLVPLVIVPNSFIFPFIVPKALLFRSVVLILLAMSAAIYFSERKQKQVKVGRSWLSWAIAAFFTSMVVSTFVGVDWYRSFWDNQERMLGLFTLLHYGAFFLICSYLFRTYDEWKKAFLVFCGVGMVVIGIGLVQKIFPNFLYNRGAGRVTSTFGNTIYLGGYGLFLFFIGWFFAIKEKINWSKWFFALSSVLGLVAIFISGTRGTLLGLLVAGIVCALMYGFLFKNHQKLRKSILIALSVVLVLGVISFAFKNTGFVKSIPVVNRLVSISPFEGSANTRLMAWEIAVESWQEKPIFGWGPNNFYYAFNKYYNPEFLKHGFQETWFDNAHNVLLNTLNTQGLFGIVSYLSIFVIAFLFLWRMFKENQDDIHLFILGTGFLVGHTIHNFFVFENISSYLYLFLFFAFVKVMRKRLKETEYQEIQGRVNIISLTVFLFLSVLGIFLTNVNVARANINGYHARGLFRVGQVDEALVRYDKIATAGSPYEGDIDWDFASDILNVLGIIYNDHSISGARELYDIAIKGIESVIEKHPQDVRARLLYMDYLRSGGLVLFELPVEETIKENLKISYQLSPERQQIKYAEITYLAGIGEMEKAIQMAGDFLAEDNMIAESYYTLARLYLFDAQYLEIVPLLDKAIRKGVSFGDGTHMIFMAEAYERDGRFLDSMYWFRRAYFSTGNVELLKKAEQLSRETKKPVPTAVDEFFNFEEPKALDTASTDNLN